MRTLIAILMMLLWCSAWSQPIQRQFFTTNTNPRVVVAAGTNVTVQYTTTGTDIRTYTVNSSGGGGTQTNISYLAVTNAPWQWGTQNLTNWSQFDTNILSSLFTNSVVAAGTNIIVGTNGLVYTVNVDMGFTNYLASTNYSVTAATNAAYNSTNGFPWTNIYSPGISGGATNQVYTQVGWSGYPQITNLSLITNGIGTAIVPTLWLTNPTPAALGAQQASPALMFAGQGWKSGDSSTHSDQLGFYALPIQGTSADPIVRLILVKSISGAALSTTGFTADSNGDITAGGINASLQVNCAANNYLGWGTQDRMYNPVTGQVSLMNSTTESGVNIFCLGPGRNAATLYQSTNWPALRVEGNTNNTLLGIRCGTNTQFYASLVASNVTASASVTATNGYVHQLYATNGYTVCTASKQFYLVNAYTNPLFVLPDASTVRGKEFIFSTTNTSCFFIVTNATGAQPIANGSYLSYTNQDNGIKVARFISDGAAWWLSAKGKTTLPCASWSCSTNTTFANVTNTITLDTVEMNNGAGIYLDNSAWFTAGVGSRMWITNAGTYMLTFSAVWSKVGATAENGDIWVRQNGVDIPRTMTLISIPNSSTNCMTVNFMLPVTGTTYFDLQGASPNGNGQLQAMPAITSPFNRPACPSIIVTLNKTSD